MRKISRKYVPTECTYRIGRRRYTSPPAGTRLKYWELNEQGNYCGVLGYNYGLFRISCLILFIFSIYTAINNSNSTQAIIQVADVMYLEDNKLAINANYKYTSGSKVVLSIEVHGVVIYTSQIGPNESIGTVECLLDLPTGDTPAIVKCKSTSNFTDVTEKSVLLKIR